MNLEIVDGDIFKVKLLCTQVLICRNWKPCQDKQIRPFLIKKNYCLLVYMLCDYAKFAVL
jgi:hypothetical protein